MAESASSPRGLFVITADQVDSRDSDDLVAETLDALARGHTLPLPAERTVGDELQLLTASATEAFSIILDLTRSGRWSVGCGVGGVRTPLPASIREASGPAFIAARDAVDRAKKAPTRFALSHERAKHLTADAEALIDLLLALRSRRTDEGWQVHDLLETGRTQAEAATALGISPQAVSDRARTADLRIEAAARDPLVRLLD
ncbi:MAG TPA: DNA-binding protein, partial [Terrimesophilobacter sp.]|nr:DNA-binding protein [Terrimesophilobacter sp.]